MSLRLLSLDLSLAATGLASTHSWRGEPRLHCTTIHTRRSTPEGIDHPRIAAVVAGIRPYVGTVKPDLCIIEWQPEVVTIDPVTGKPVIKGEATLRTAELHGVVEHWLFANRVPYVHVKPTYLQMYATGKGRATKTAVRAAITARVGRLVHIADDNQADAVTMLCLASAHYGQPIETAPSDRHRRALTALRWPEIDLPEVAALAALAGGKAGPA